MTTLSADQELVLRTWVGDDPTTSELEELYDAVGSWDEVVRSTIRRKLALLTEEPTSLSVPGLSISNGQQLLSLQQMLKDFNSSDGTGLDEEASVGMSTAQIVRVNQSR